MKRTYCPICRTAFDVTEALLGQKGFCSTCGAKFLITSPDPETSRETGRTTQPLTMNSVDSTSSSKTSPATTGIVLATTLAVVTAALFYWLSAATIPDGLTPWVDFLGKMHPLFVHYPVAWVTAIFVLGIFGGAKHNQALRILLWLNLLTCAAGIVAGQCASTDYGSKVTLHLWAGLSVGGFSWLALVLFLRSPGVHGRLYQLAVLGAMGSVAAAGHLGATLTHGEILDHLPWKETAPTKQSQSQTLGDSLPVGERTVLDAVILPILQARCVGCHGPEKQKGGLRLDSYAAMLAKGESEKASIVPANPEASESLVRVKLPADDEDHMPPSKKPQLEPAELAVLQWWVQAGADPKLKLAEAPAPAAVKQQLQAIAASPPK